MDNAKRAANFSKAEEQLLISLAAKHRKVLEFKKTDAVSSQAKEAEWKLLAEEFKVHSNTFRNHQTLRRKYENLKKRSKEAFSDKKCYYRSTGGGSSLDVKITETDLYNKEMLGTQVTGLQSEFYDDVEVNVTGEQIIKSIEDEDENEEMEFTYEPQFSETDTNEVVECSSVSASSIVPSTGAPRNTYATYTRSMLQTPRSVQLMPILLQHKMTIEDIRHGTNENKEHSAKQDMCNKPRTNSTRNKRNSTMVAWISVAERKLELIEIQKQSLKMDMEHKQVELALKVQYLKKEHELNLKSLRLDIKIKKKQLKD